MTIVFKLIIFTTLRIIAPVAPVPSLSALPAISRCNHCVPSSIKASKYLHLNNQLNILIMIFIFIAVLLFLTPIIGSSEIIEFNHNEVRYFHTKGYFQQFAEVIRILTGKQAVPDITLKTKDIEQVNLSYVPFLMMYAQQGYQIKITFLMKDGTTLAFLPSTIDQMEKGDYESAFKILETNGVEIVDKLMLRTA